MKGRITIPSDVLFLAVKLGRPWGVRFADGENETPERIDVGDQEHGHGIGGDEHDARCDMRRERVGRHDKQSQRERQHTVQQADDENLQRKICPKRRR